MHLRVANLLRSAMGGILFVFVLWLKPARPARRQLPILRFFLHGGGRALAILGALLALVPTGYGIYRWRVRLLRQHNVELEHKVLERTEQLEKASAAKTEFVANMSHDIRNPLNGIVGLALALEDTWLDGKQRELVATLRECTTYLSTLVDDVLDFSSIEAGQVELRPGPFSPAELLRSIAMMFKMEAIASGAVLKVEARSPIARRLRR